MLIFHFCGQQEKHLQGFVIYFFKFKAFDVDQTLVVVHFLDDRQALGELGEFDFPNWM